MKFQAHLEEILINRREKGEDKATLKGKELGVSKLVTGKELWSQNRVPEKNCGLKSGNRKRIGDHF